MAVTVPDWADTLLDLIGVSWPNVDEDAYRDMADSLREFAEDLEDDGQLANNHSASGSVRPLAGSPDLFVRSVRQVAGSSAVRPRPPDGLGVSRPAIGDRTSSGRALSR
ncbi:hypothetical protein ACFYRC_03025 [Streptomyces sp. NPDC005279]|uniref:hypothetical protein n=1 Tax=Streptomyces sp. NPDC005279 TaxID=3364712 RepID=UPI003694B3D8